jgi:hypothetical protein
MKSSNTFNRKIIPLSAFFGLLILIGWAYSFGLSGAWQYDDEPNLKGLANVNDFSTALEFTFTGIAGPTGRPLALATFAAQAEHWPDNPHPFLVVNLAIHLANVSLVFLLALALAKIVRSNNIKVYWFSVVVAALWGLSPFLASTSLIVVQRMTGLSGTFILLGLLLYIAGRQQLHARPLRAGLFILVGICGGTLLATLSKENGALLPVYALAIECSLLLKRLPTLGQCTKRCLFVFLITPLIALVAYLTYRAVSQAGYELRDFTIVERLLTQPRVLLDYLSNLLLPRQFSVTPFSDNFLVSESLLAPPSTLIALAIFVGCFLLAWIYRKTTPILIFAVSWFFGGHLIESSVIPLEIYFAHRNYLPAFGVYFLIGHIIFFNSFSDSMQKIAYGLAAIYVGFFTLILIDATRLWGIPPLAAEVWYLEREDSSRAAQFLARMYESERDFIAADKVISKTRALNPDNVWLTLKSLDYCAISKAEYLHRLEEAREALASSKILSFFDIQALNYLAKAKLGSADCDWLTSDRFFPLVEAASIDANLRSVPQSQHLLFYTRAWYHLSNDEPSAAIAAYKAALEIYPHHETVVLIAHLMAQIGQTDQAIEFLEEKLLQPPNRTFARAPWEDRISEFLETLQPDS